ncbi:MAG: hypothetical protein JXA94_06595 [Parachlamydiales bacterium]|nr:hypothetical protein [Parachlamydiales bacterium]
MAAITVTGRTPSNAGIFDPPSAASATKSLATINSVLTALEGVNLNGHLLNAETVKRDNYQIFFEKTRRFTDQLHALDKEFSSLRIFADYPGKDDSDGDVQSVVDNLSRAQERYAAQLSRESKFYALRRNFKIVKPKQNHPIWDNFIWTISLPFKTIDFVSRKTGSKINGLALSTILASSLLWKFDFISTDSCISAFGVSGALYGGKKFIGIVWTTTKRAVVDFFVEPPNPRRA